MWRVMAVLASDGQPAPDRPCRTDQHRRLDPVATGDAPGALGLVTRTRSASSNREVAVKLSARGDALVGRLIPIAQDYEATAIAGLPPQELAVLKRCLRRVYRNMKDNGARVGQRESGRGRAA